MDKNIKARNNKFVTILLQELETLHAGELISLGITEAIFDP
jgi:hypothetical protein